MEVELVNSKSAKILITGSTGFLGRNVKTLLERSGYVVICPRTYNYIPDWNMLSEQDLEEIFQVNSPDVIVHTAWGIDVPNYRSNLVNLEWQETTLKFCKLAAENGVKHFISFGSFSETEPDITSGNELDKSVYAESKRETCDAVLRIGAESDLLVSWMRIFYPYGVGDKPKRLIPLLMSNIMDGMEISLQSPQLQLDLVHSLDIANSVRFAIESRHEGVFDVKSNKKMTIQEISELIKSLYGISVKEIQNEIPFTKDNFISWLLLQPLESEWQTVIPLKLGILSLIRDIELRRVEKV